MAQALLLLVVVSNSLLLPSLGLAGNGGLCLLCHECFLFLMLLLVCFVESASCFPPRSFLEFLLHSFSCFSSIHFLSFFTSYTTCLHCILFFGFILSLLGCSLFLFGALYFHCIASFAIFFCDFLIVTREMIVSFTNNALTVLASRKRKCSTNASGYVPLFGYFLQKLASR